MDAGLLIVFIIVALAVAAVAIRATYEKRNHIGGRNSTDAPGGWFGGE